MTASIPSAKEILHSLDLGSSVAEHDELLQQHFVETGTFRKLISDKVDIIAGDKGTGKTAIFRILKERYATYPELSDVEIVAAFNPAGTPVFQRLIETDILAEDQYIGVWKSYFLALAGNWVLNLGEGDFSKNMKDLDGLLTDVGLRSDDETPQTIFAKVVGRLKKLFRVKSLENTTTFSAEGMPVLSTRLDFSDASERGDAEPVEFVRQDDALRLLQRVMSELDFKIWLVVDRLDEAFQAKPTLEKPALRALLRTYLDMLDLENVRLKLFVRRDLFSRIVEGGFVNLTHINARRVDITWDDDDLFDLLSRRLRSSPEFLSLLGVEGASDSELFHAVFPDQVDPGDRKPLTWTWMLGRVRDANGVKPPRNLIDLVLKAQESQQRREERSPRTFNPNDRLITSDALKRGLEALSVERVQDTLLAEAGGNAGLIEHFRGGKAEHNNDSLKLLLGADYEWKVDFLKTIGFLESVGSNYKIPMLYRGGLGITQGKAFSDELSAEEG